MERTFYRGSQRIIKNYERKIKQIRNLQILGLIREKMSLSRKNPSLGKKVVSFALAGVMVATGIGLLRQNHDSEDLPEHGESYATVHENPAFSFEEDRSQTVSPEIIEGDDWDSLLEEEDDGTLFDDGSEKKDDPEIIKRQAIQEMVSTPKEFHYSYHEDDTPDYLEKAKRYDDIFEKYGKRFGIDKELIRAMAAQEGYGDHERCIDVGPAEGIMQIEKSVWLGETVTAYNFETQQYESVEITLDKLQDLDSCIMIGTMICQKNLHNNSCNIPLTLQSYNFGSGNIQKMLNTCSALEGVSVDSLKEPDNNQWLRYRAFLNTGDPNYVEHVCRFIPEGSTITVLDLDGTSHSIKFVNDYQKTK